jgi:hypothetical protein
MGYENEVGKDLEGKPRRWERHSREGGVSDVVPGAHGPFRWIEKISWERTASNPERILTEQFEITVPKALQLKEPLTDEILRSRFTEVTKRKVSVASREFEISLVKGSRRLRIQGPGMSGSTFHTVEELGCPGFPGEISFIEVPIEYFLWLLR